MLLDRIHGLMAEHEKDIRVLGVKQLAVFGSAASGEAGAESDIDIFVDFEGPASFDRYMGLKVLLEDLLGRRVDLVTRKALRPSLKAAIEREAVNVAQL